MAGTPDQPPAEIASQETTLSLWIRAWGVHWVYTFCVLAAGLVFTWVTPPMQGPDEAVHLIRAIQLARGDVHGIRHPTTGTMGTTIPVAVHNDLKFFSRFIFDQAVGIKRADTAEARRNAPGWTSELFAKQEFAPCQFEHYPPVAHLPQALAVRITYHAGGNVFDAMYLGRALNVLVATCLLGSTFWLLRAHPMLQLLCFAIAATPAAASLYGSLTADPLTIVTSLLVLAIAVRLRERWGGRMFVMLLVAAAVLSLCKNVYFILPAIAVPAIWCSEKSWRIRITRFVLLALACVVPLALWLWYIRDLTAAPALATMSAKPADQAQKVLDAPLYAVWQWLSYLWQDFRYLRRAIVGVTGWGDMLLSAYIIECYFWTLVAIAVIGCRKCAEKRWGTFDAVIRIATVAGIALAIYMALLVMTGRGLVHRTQGRYYLPILPVAMSVFPLLVMVPKWTFAIWRGGLVLGWATVMILAIMAVDDRFSGPERVSLRIGEMSKTKIEEPKRGGYQKRPNGDFVLRALAPTTYRLVLKPGTRRLEVEFGVLDHPWQEGTDGVEFQVVAVLAESKEQVLWSRLLDPKQQETDRGAQVASVSIPEKGVRRLLLKTLPGPSGSNAWDWGYWRRADFND